MSQNLSELIQVLEAFFQLIGDPILMDYVPDMSVEQLAGMFNE